MENLNPFVPTHVLYTNIGTPEETRTELAGFEPDELNTDPDQREGGLGFYDRDDWYSEERCSDWSLDGDGYLCFQGSRLITHCGAYKLVRVEDDVTQYASEVDFALDVCMHGVAIVNDTEGDFVHALGSTTEQLAVEWSDDAGWLLDAEELCAGYEVYRDRSGARYIVVGLSEGAFRELERNRERRPESRRDPLVRVCGDHFALYSEVKAHGLDVGEDRFGGLIALRRIKDADSISTSAVG